MKYLVIILLLLFSCKPMVDRVDDDNVGIQEDEPTVVDKIKDIDDFVKTKQYGATPAPAPEPVGYEEIGCGKTSKHCIKKVKIITPNKYGITRVWVEYVQYAEDDLMSTEWNLYSRVYVATKHDKEDKWFGYKNKVDIDDIEKHKESLLKEANKEMHKLIKQVLSKPLKNE